MKFEDYMLLPKERLAQLLVEAEERYNSLLTSAVSTRSGSTCSEHISSVRREAALKRWHRQPMQNMQIASCKSDTNTDNCYANAMQIAMQNEDTKTDANAMKIASCKCNSESDTNDANAMQIEHAKSDAKQAICIECEEKETNEERKKKKEIKKEIKKEDNKEKEPILKKENIYIKEKNALPTDFTPIAANGKEKEKGCAEKEKEETGVVGDLSGESDTLPQQPEKMQEMEGKAAKTGHYFDFRKRLIAMVREDAHSDNYESVVDDWMRVRRNKRASNTQTAFNRVKSQIEKARRSLNMTAEECVRMSAEHSWQGFECEWARNFIGADRTGRNNKQIAPAADFRDID